MKLSVKSLLSRYESDLETSIREIDSIFDSVQVMYDKCHRVNFRHGGSYIDSPDWIKKEKNSNKSDENAFNVWWQLY